MISYSEKTKHAYSGTATTIDVLKAFWRGMSRHKPTLFFSIFGVALARIFAIIIPIYYKKFFDILSQVASVDARVAELISIITVILGFNLVVWAGYRLGTFASVHFQAKVIADLKQISFDYMIDHSYAFYANNFTGSLVQRVNRFARAFETLADRIIFDVLPLFFQISGVCVVLWFTNPVITYVLLVWIFIFLSFNYVFSRWKLKYDVKRASVDSFTTGVLSDAVSNQNNIQLFTGSKFESGYFKKVTDDQATLTKFVWNLQGGEDTVQSLLIFIIEFLLFYFAIKYWQQGIITIGTFVLIQVYLVGLGGHLWDFSRVIRNIYEAFADAKEMVDILKYPHDVKNLPNAEVLNVPKGEVNFEDVGFSFNKERSVLLGLNLKIRSGEKVALIGPSGAGKSTFVKLLLRLYDVSSGRISIDGQDICLVTQESFRQNVNLISHPPT